MKRHLVWPLLVVVALFITACGAQPEQAEIELLPNHVQIEMIGLRFFPSEIEIEPGTQVVFVNADRMHHNVVHGKPRETTDEPLFESPTLRGGQKWAYVFDEAGEYPFMCTISGHHLRGMVGQITVREKQSTPQDTP